MWFCSTIRNARLEGTVLIADCQTSAGDWQQSLLDLDHYLGNDDGIFTWQGERFNSTAKYIQLKNTTLSACLRTQQATWLEASIDLNYYLTNEDGHLMIAEVHQSGFAETCRNAVIIDGVLHAECSTLSGEFRKSSINLNGCIGNSDGEFRWGWSNFSATAQDVCLEGTHLHARLATIKGEWHNACTDLQTRIRNMGGNLRRGSSRLEATKPRHLDFKIGTPMKWNSPHFLKEEARIQRDRDELTAQHDRRLALRECLMVREPYQYDPLRKGKNIRLMKLDPPGRTSDVIACSLVEVELGSAERFAALSYTWGSPFPPTIDSVEHGYTQDTTILCNGKRLQIKPNLYDALRRLRYRTRATRSQAHFDGIDLIAGVQSGSLFKVEDMLRLGADVQARDDCGRTALHFAAKMGHVDMAKALVAAGSDIHALCKLKKKPLDYAKEGNGRYINSVTRFLEEHGNDHKRHRVNTSLRLDVTEFEYFWIDAICINQGDELEKAAQVSIMGEIYRASGCVNVWLGREFHNYGDTTELMLHGLWRLEQAREKDALSAESLEQLVNDPVATFRQIGDSRIKRAATEWLDTLGLDTVGSWFHMPSLFQRTWFGRAWILQEVLMAEDLTIFCGRYIVPWDIFLLMSSIIECCRSLLGTDELRTVLPSTIWDRFFGMSLSGGGSLVRNGSEQHHVSPLRLAQLRTKYQREGKLSMVSALTLSRNQKATDARDKVFCVLAFSSIERKIDHVIHSIKPDYSLSPALLYVDVAKSLFAVYGPCILSLSGIDSRSMTTDLPTWVPDLNGQLTSRLRGIDVRQLHYNASAIPYIGKTASKIPSDVHITSQNELVIKGHLWDVVAETAHSGVNEVGRNLDGLARWLEVLSKLEGSIEQKREALSCSLAETSLEEHPQGSHFQDWLKFLCCTSIIGQPQILREIDVPVIPLHVGDVPREQGQESIDTLLSRAQEHFAMLGLTLSSDTIKSWCSGEIWGTQIVIPSCQWYRDMVRDAMHYGQMLRDNNPTRRLLRTTLTNRLGTGPRDAQLGDVIVLVEGFNVPYLLRRARDGKFELIGETYIHGLRVEEILEDTRGHGKLQDIYII